MSVWADTPPNPRRAEAERLFEEASRRMDARDFVVACPMLVESHALDPSSGTLLNLGDCYEQLGRGALAWRAFFAARELSVASAKRDRAEVAELRMNRLAPRVHFVQVIPPARPVAGLVITLDGEALPPSRWKTPFAVEPGTHVLRVSAPGFTEYRALLAEGSLGEAAPHRVPELEPASVPGARDAGTRALDGQAVAAIASGAVGVAGVVVGTVFGLRSLQKHEESDRYCRGSLCDDVRGVDAMDQARRAGNLATGAFIVGGVGLGAGAVLGFVRPFGKATAVTLDVGPGALRMRGRF